MDRARRKVLRGKVKSDKMNKTVVVDIQRLKTHPLYGKVIKRLTRVYADNPDNLAHAGDEVEIMETRPLSKLKRFRVVKVLQGTK